MVQVDFYVLRSASPGGAAMVACKVAEKAWKHGFRVFVHAASEHDARGLDDLLWTFRQDSFVPHALAGDDETGREPVLIGHDISAARGRQVLVNLHPGLSAEIGGFERIAEIVADQDDARGAARARYARYRDLGHELKHHDVQP